MKSLNLLMAALLIIFAYSGISKAQNSFVTGYVATEGEVLTGDVTDKVDYDKGAGLSEAGLIYSIKPKDPLEFKVAFVHKPGVNLDLSFVELWGQWKLKDALALKAGRILSPLSPVNLFCYAPMNYGIAVPLLVSHHAFYPQSIEGVEINGRPNDMFRYNLIAGGYYSTSHVPLGALKFHGAECAFVWDYDDYNEAGIDIMHHLVDEGNAPTHVNPCVGGRAVVSPLDFLEVGASFFYGQLEEEGEKADGTIEEVSAAKQYIGLTGVLKHNNLKLSGEYWTGKVAVDGYDDIDGVGYYVEADYTIAEKFTPFVKYEYHEDVPDEYYSRPTIGASFRPNFNFIFKAEFHIYSAPKAMDGEGMNFNSFMVQLVYSM